MLRVTQYEESPGLGLWEESLYKGDSITIVRALHTTIQVLSLKITYCYKLNIITFFTLEPIIISKSLKSISKLYIHLHY